MVEKGDSKAGKGGASNSAFMRPLKPDKVLGAIVGNDPIPRTEITKRLWKYIKEHKLQDGRNILAKKDAKLKAFFEGAKDTTMFTMSSQVSNHTTGGKPKDKKPAKKAKGNDEEE